MTKRLSKREQLDFIVSEIESIKSAMKKLFKQQLLLIDLVGKLAKPAPEDKASRPKSKPKAPAKKAGQPGKPVLVKTQNPVATLAPPRSTTAG